MLFMEWFPVLLSSCAIHDVNREMINVLLKRLRFDNKHIKLCINDLSYTSVTSSFFKSNALSGTCGLVLHG